MAEELASDGGKEFTAQETQQFFKSWSVHHRLSSVAFPHSNCRGELAVKQIKRIITSNISTSGSLDIDSFHKGILSYRNTIDPVTRFSPAMANERWPASPPRQVQPTQHVEGAAGSQRKSPSQETCCTPRGLVGARSTPRSFHP